MANIGTIANKETGLSIRNKLNAAIGEVNRIAVQDNLTATTDPTVNDDSGAGYAPRSLWVNGSTGEVFRCIDATSGAAVWVKTSLTIDELGTAATKDTGTAIGDVVALVDNGSGTPALPAVSGENLTGVGGGLAVGDMIYSPERTIPKFIRADGFQYSDTDYPALAAIFPDMTADTWRYTNPSQTAFISASNSSMRCAFSQDSTMLAVADYGSSASICRLFNTSDWSEITGKAGLSASYNAYAVAFSPDNAMVSIAYNGSGAANGRVVDIATGNVLHSAASNPSWLAATDFSPNGTWVAYAGTLTGGPQVYVYNTSDWTLATSHNHSLYTRSVDFSPDSSMLATGGGTSLVVRSTSDWSVVHSQGFAGQVSSARFSPSGELVAVSYDAAPFLTILKTSDWSEIPLNGSIPVGPAVNFYCDLDFSTDNRFVAFGVNRTAANGYKGWEMLDTKTMDFVPTPGSSQPVVGVAFSPDGAYLAGARNNSFSYIYEPEALAAFSLNIPALTSPTMYPHIKAES